MDVNRIALADELVPYKHRTAESQDSYIICSWIDICIQLVYPYFFITTTIIIVCFPVMHRRDIAL